jgi:hypothetical protein
MAARIINLAQVRAEREKRKADPFAIWQAWGAFWVFWLGQMR